jgi:two-component system alkaline phosphatase synthesis response regulator PhoP
MEKARILVVDDENDILELLRYNLEREGYPVACVASGEAALQEIERFPPNLIILDLMLPGLDGLEVCKIVKNNTLTATIPIIMLTAKGSEADIVIGLELGADDYITKPFSPREFIARVKSVLRRSTSESTSEADIIRRHEIVIDLSRREVIVEGDPVTLTTTEFEILRLLARRPGWVLTRDQIIDGVRGDNYAVTDRSVDVHITGLRKKLQNAGKYIETIRGVGYRLKE